jgi:hypothetical protein
VLIPGAGERYHEAYRENVEPNLDTVEKASARGSPPLEAMVARETFSSRISATAEGYRKP